MPFLILERDGPVATLTLNQPEKRNAINQAMWADLPRIAMEVENDPDSHILIVRGAGEHAFSAGADIAEFEEVYRTPESAERYNEQVRIGQIALSKLTKPTLAAIRGVCIGGGCGIALCCDIRIAAKGSRFGITPARLGLAYSFEDTMRLVDIVGPAFAKDILFSGRIFGVEDAERMGLVTGVVERETFEDEITAYVARLIEASQYSVRTAKAVISAISAGETMASGALQAQIRASFDGPDFKEGYSAFQERRKPRFTWE